MNVGERLWPLLLLLAVVLGCGDGKSFDVTGKVTMKSDGKPLEGATIVFRPVENPDSFSARGYVAEDGTYHLTTKNPNDGIPAGKYQIAVMAKLPRVDRDKVKGPPPSPIDPKYSKYESSGLEFTVSPQGPHVYDIQVDPNPGTK